MKLALVGYGALGRYIEEMIGEAFMVEADHTVYFDDHLEHPGARPFAAWSSDAYRDHAFFVCLGYKHLKLKKQIVDRLIELDRELPSYIHRSSYVHPTVRLGVGSMVYPGCSIDRNTQIGNGTWITNADVIAHDCAIGDACWFGATVTLSGIVKVGTSTFIGSGSTIANDARIGSNVIIGMGSAVTRDVADDQSVIGNPMRILERSLKLV